MTEPQPISLLQEEKPPHFRRAQALPYPDLKRVWARIELTPFAAHPDLEMAILGPDGSEEASMIMVDVQHPYVSLTLHLRHPQPGALYQLCLRLIRDGMLLDQRTVPFALAFVDRDEARAQAEAVIWTDRTVAITPLPDEGEV